MWHGARRWERHRAEFTVVPESVAWHDERGAFTAAFQVQPERLRELFAVVTPDPPAHPVRLGLVQVGGVHEGVVDQAAAHASAGVWLGLYLAKPAARIGGYVGCSEVRDDMQQASVVDR